MAKMMTDATVQAALRKVTAGREPVVFLTDPAPKGAGRLTAKIRPGLVEWYARRTVGGKRSYAKLGQLPDMTLAQAREAFARGPDPVVAPSAPLPGATFADLVAGYVAALAAAGKKTAQPTQMLGQAAAVIGPGTPAAEVMPQHIVRVLKPIYDRGAPVMADKMRMWLNAAFRWGLTAEHDYRVAVPRRWGLVSNPVAAVPRDSAADRVGERWLSRKEFVDLLDWAGGSRASSRRAIALLALTGQRVHEIIDLRAGQWDSKERLLSWPRTKNGLPHVVPVCAQAAAILDAIRPNEHGWLFPGARDPSRPMTDAGVLAALVKYAARWKLPAFTGRDLRRTWKTLAGEAGLSKLERDMLQNHTESGDVSSRHYDRYDGLREKRAAVAKWEAWLRLEAQPLRHVVVRRVELAKLHEPAD
jgi:integrase